MKHTPTPFPSPLQHYWREIDGAPECGIFFENHPGNAYAVARCPRYIEEPKWGEYAETICSAVNSTYGEGINPAGVKAAKEALEKVLSAHGKSVRLGLSSKKVPDEAWEKAGQDIADAMQQARDALKALSLPKDEDCPTI